MNYKCVWIVSFADFFFTRKYPPGKSILSTAEEISTLLKLHVAANTFFSFATHEAVKTVTPDLLL